MKKHVFNVDIYSYIYLHKTHCGHYLDLIL